MSKPLDDYTARTANWRATLKRNSRKTCLVIAIFFAIYIALGLLIDVYLYASSYPNAKTSVIVSLLLTLKIPPYATLITTAIAMVALWVTFAFHNKLMLLGAEYTEITPATAKSPEQRQLYNVIEEMKVAAGLHFMPRIFIIEADYMNAFASGYSEKSAMVAITRGLMEKLSRDELQAVMAHELSHIRHMDIRLTLMASVLANIMLIVVDVFFYSVIFGRNRRNGASGWLVIAIYALRILLPIITVLLMLFLSRQREYMADAGCVELMRTNEPLARALLKIEEDHKSHREDYSAAYKKTAHESVRREAYIFDPLKAGIESKSSISDFFSTHPTIQKRLHAIGFIKQHSNQ
jgi:heat shock protein HtpX